MYRLRRNFFQEEFLNQNILPYEGKIRRRPEFPQAITVKISDRQRKALEVLADRGQVSPSHATRLLLDRGLASLEA
jgi:hypothetical protein